mmetsp:Transcript_59051/g.133352  ORF Transcript_59051/g.133352 Transcript_59051/m.133352 type:complete len:239 (-) Transcript_59051:166-882(-)
MGGHTHHRIVHESRECRHHHLVVLLLNIRRVVRGSLTNCMQRRIAHPGVFVAEEGNKEFHDLVHVCLLHYCLCTLGEGHNCHVLVLPAAMVNEEAHILKDNIQDLLRTKSLCKAVDVLFAHIVVGDIDVAAINNFGPVLVLLQLQHELHARIHRLLDEAGELCAHICPLLAERSEKFEGHLPYAVLDMVPRSTDREHHRNDLVQVPLEGDRGNVCYLHEGLQTLLQVVLLALKLLHHG